MFFFPLILGPSTSIFKACESWTFRFIAIFTSLFYIIFTELQLKLLFLFRAWANNPLYYWSSFKVTQSNVFFCDLFLFSVDAISFLPIAFFILRCSWPHSGNNKKITLTCRRVSSILFLYCLSYLSKNCSIVSNSFA